MVSTIHSDFGDIHMVPSLVARKAVSSKEEAFPSPAWCSRSHDRKQPSKKYPVQPMCWNKTSVNMVWLLTKELLANPTTMAQRWCYYKAQPNIIWMSNSDNKLRAAVRWISQYGRTERLVPLGCWCKAVNNITAIISLLRPQNQWNAPKDGHYHLPILTWLVNWLRHSSVWVGCRHVSAGKPYGPFHGFSCTPLPCTNQGC